MLGEWIGTVEPLQPWIARATWIPEFNTYDEFMQTIYESAVAPDWHRGGSPAADTMATLLRPRRLWLDPVFR